MNILISTTNNWNCGDDFIRFGVKNILNKIFFKPNYIHYDRNPDYMINYPYNQKLRTGCVSSIMNNPINFEIIDLIVLAGSPEFLHCPMIPIYEGLLEHPETPLWAIGVGYADPYWGTNPSNAEVEALKRDNTLIISRQLELSNRLEVLLKKEIHTLPCPALFCFEKFAEKTKEKLTILQNKETITPDGDIAYHAICDYKKGGYFNSDPYDMLKHIGQYKKVISQRLHGTIAAISSGSMAVLDNTSFRATEGIKLFKEVIDADSQSILEFKLSNLAHYLKILNNAKSFFVE